MREIHTGIYLSLCIYLLKLLMRNSYNENQVYVFVLLFIFANTSTFTLFLRVYLRFSCILNDVFVVAGMPLVLHGMCK